MSSKLVSSLAKVYDPNASSSRGKPGNMAGDTEDQHAQSFNIIQVKIESLSEKMDKLIRLQGKVISRLDGMSQEIGDIELDMETLMVDREDARVLPTPPRPLEPTGTTQVKEMCREMTNIMSAVNQRTEQQEKKLEGMERLVLGIQEVISFIGETVKGSQLMELLFKRGTASPSEREASPTPKEKAKDKSKESIKRKASADKGESVLSKKLDQLKDQKGREGKDKPRLSVKLPKKPLDSSDTSALTKQPVLLTDIQKLNQQNAEKSGRTQATASQDLETCGEVDVPQVAAKSQGGLDRLNVILAPAAKQDKEGVEAVSMFEAEKAKKEKEVKPPKTGEGKDALKKEVKDANVAPAGSVGPSARETPKTQKPLPADASVKLTEKPRDVDPKLQRNDESKSVPTKKDEIKSILTKKDESKSVLTKKDESKSVLTKKEESKSVLTKKDETKSVLTKKDESKSVLTKKDESKLALTKKDEIKSVLTKKDESKSVLIKKDESKSVLIKKDESKLALTKKDEIKSVLTKKDESKSVLTKKDESKSVLTKKDESKSVLTKTDESKSVLTKKDESKSVLTKKDESKLIPPASVEAQPDHSSKEASGSKEVRAPEDHKESRKPEEVKEEVIEGGKEAEEKPEVAEVEENGESDRMAADLEEFKRLWLQKKEELEGLQCQQEEQDVQFMIDVSHPPIAPFSHRIVAPKPNQINNFYTINKEEILGGGRFGQVHKCVENSSGLTLAAKIIKARSPKEKELVKNEIQVMNQLDHATLIQLYAAYESRLDVVLVLEYVAGGELFDRIIDENYKLTELDSVHFIRQICEGVQHMHKMSIVHLDLKPENILCVNRVTNKIKIIDFGLARMYKPREKLKVSFGTPEFLAPEVVNYEFVSFRTDMWSLGVITYMLLSSLSPFLGDDDNETLNNILACQWTFEEEEFTDISEEARDFISKLLVLNKSWRMNSNEALEHAWLSDPGLHYRLHRKKNKCRSRRSSCIPLAD